MVHLQEDGCVCSYGAVRCTGIGINSIEHSLLPTRLLILVHLKRLYHACIYNRLTEDEPSGSRHVEDTKIKNWNISLEKVHFVGFCCIVRMDLKEIGWGRDGLIWLRIGTSGALLCMWQWWTFGLHKMRVILFLISCKLSVSRRTLFRFIPVWCVVMNTNDVLQSKAALQCLSPVLHVSVQRTIMGLFLFLFLTRRLPVAYGLLILEVF